mmetsp:Transcript_17735/g.56147  ORF Transcript_17735/g.56147 Transcript_17735/m.56147 type:complete len:92 (+) Transcript_17735:58-333(+)
MGGKLTCCCPVAVVSRKRTSGRAHPAPEGKGADNSSSSEQKVSLISDNGSNHGPTPEHKSKRFADAARSVKLEKALSKNIAEATYSDALGN